MLIKTYHQTHSPKHTPSQYIGGLDMDDRTYIARVYWSHVYKVGQFFL